MTIRTTYIIGLLLALVAPLAHGQAVGQRLAPPVDSVVAGTVGLAPPATSWGFRYNDPAAAAANATAAGLLGDAYGTAPLPTTTFAAGDVWLRNASGAGGGLDVEFSQGGRIEGAGIYEIFWGEADAANKNRTSATRLIGHGATEVINYDGRALMLGGVTLQGYTAATFTDFVAEWDAGYDDFAEVGIRISDATGGTSGTGKLTSSNLSIIGAKTGIYLGSTAAGNQADSLHFDRLVATCVGTLLKSRSGQNIGLYFGDLQLHGVETVWDFDNDADVASGSVFASTLTIGNVGAREAVTILKTGLQSVNNPDFRIGTLWVDGSIDDVQLWESDQSSGARLMIDFFRRHNGTATVGVHLVGENQFYLGGASNMPDNFITYDGTGTAKPYARLSNITWGTGENAVDPVASGSGVMHVLLDWNIPTINTAGPAPPAVQTYTDGVLSNTAFVVLDDAIDTSAELRGIVTDENGGGAFLCSGAVNAAFTNITLAGTLNLITDNVRQTFNPGATNAGLNVGAHAGDPSAPADGDLWYDSAAGELTARIAGANVALGAGGGGGGGAPTDATYLVESANGTLSAEVVVGELTNATELGWADGPDLSRGGDGTLLIENEAGTDGSGLLQVGNLNVYDITAAAFVQFDVEDGVWSLGVDGDGGLDAGALVADSLTLTAPLSVAGGGTGAGTLTGVLIGNGTSAVTAIVTGVGVEESLSESVNEFDGLVTATGETTTFGRDLLNLADAAAGRTAFDAQQLDADLTDLADGTLSGSKVSAASDSAAGVVELAIASELNTGTDTDSAVTPDALAGSNLGIRYVALQDVGRTTDVATGDGEAVFVVPAALSGMNIVSVLARVSDDGTTGDTTCTVKRDRGGSVVDVLSGDNMDINSTEFLSTDGDPGTIDTSNDDLATGDLLYLNVSAVSTTPPKGLVVIVGAQLP